MCASYFTRKHQHRENNIQADRMAYSTKISQIFSLDSTRFIQEECEWCTMVIRPKGMGFAHQSYLASVTTECLPSQPGEP
jgi:hypothetical protein